MGIEETSTTALRVHLGWLGETFRNGKKGKPTRGLTLMKESTTWNVNPHSIFKPLPTITRARIAFPSKFHLSHIVKKKMGKRKEISGKVKRRFFVLHYISFFFPLLAKGFSADVHLDRRLFDCLLFVFLFCLVLGNLDVFERKQLYRHVISITQTKKECVKDFS